MWDIIERKISNTKVLQFAKKARLEIMCNEIDGISLCCEDDES